MSNLTVEQITAAAEVLSSLADEQAYREIKNFDTHWYLASAQLQAVAEKRTPKPKKLRVFADLDSEEMAVYVERPDGKYVAVYVHEDYTDGRSVNSVGLGAAIAEKHELIAQQR